jgi:hypothetical protein
MWSGELLNLKREYTVYLEERKRLMMGEDEDEIKISKKKVVVKSVVKKVVTSK